MEFHWPTAGITAGVLLLLVIIIVIVIITFSNGQARKVKIRDADVKDLFLYDDHSDDPFDRIWNEPEYVRPSDAEIVGLRKGAWKYAVDTDTDAPPGSIPGYSISSFQINDTELPNGLIQNTTEYFMPNTKYLREDMTDEYGRPYGRDRRDGAMDSRGNVRRVQQTLTDDITDTEFDDNPFFGDVNKVSGIDYLNHKLGIHPIPIDD